MLFFNWLWWLCFCANVYKQHQIWKPTLPMTFDNLSFLLVWDNLCKIIHSESLSSISDVSQYPPPPIIYGPVTIENRLKCWRLISMWRLTWKLRNNSTTRRTNARHFLGICVSCWFQQDGVAVYTTTRARSWLKSRFGGKSSAAWPRTSGRPGVRTCPPTRISGPGAWQW